MTFESLLKQFVGQTAEVFVANSMYEGTLQLVRLTLIQIDETPVVYQPPETVTIPAAAIEYVRIVV
ncbi:MAG: hypothetical protein OWT27_01065 [Firmicutes bacterium]|nr:hypothetical protein [Bacillota bacterium]